MHIPVLLNEVKELVEKNKIKSVIDLTFGAGGHSKMFLESGCSVIGIDRDSSVEEFAIQLKEKYKDKFSFYNDKFSEFDKYCEKVDLVFADLGTSTMQLETERGFSFMNNSELDMRMGCSDRKLATILRKMPRYKIEEIIKLYGQERNYKKIAYNIDNFRLKKEINTTFDLRDACGTTNYSTLARIFQAFRIFLNDELEEIELMIKKAKEIAEKSVAIITFHSLEDKIIKENFKIYRENGFIVPSDEEIIQNPKSRSAKMRFAIISK